MPSPVRNRLVFIKNLKKVQFSKNKKNHPSHPKFATFSPQIFPNFAQFARLYSFSFSPANNKSKPKAAFSFHFIILLSYKIIIIIIMTKKSPPPASHRASEPRRRNCSPFPSQSRHLSPCWRGGRNPTALMAREPLGCG